MGRNEDVVVSSMETEQKARRTTGLDFQRRFTDGEKCPLMTQSRGTAAPH